MGTIISILDDCVRVDRFFVMQGETDDPSKFKWFEEETTAVAYAKFVYIVLHNRKNYVRVYDTKLGRFVYEAS